MGSVTPVLASKSTRSGTDGHKISFFLEVWFSCDEQKDRQEGVFFNLGCNGQEASCCRGKLFAGRQRFIEGKCLVVQHDFQQRG